MSTTLPASPARLEGEPSLFRALSGPVAERVLVLDHVAGLADGLGPAEAERLRRLAVAPVLRVDAGPWDPFARPDRIAGGLGLLVLDGVLTRTVLIEGRGAAELVGPGDLIDPAARTDGLDSLELTTRWCAVTPVTLAVLDARFVRRAGGSPHLLRALLARGLERARNVTILLAITRARRAEDRVRQLFWHMADRWGRVTPEGIVIPLSLTHRTIGQLVGLRRPSVTTALAHLTGEGELTRRFDGIWLLALPRLPRRRGAMGA